MLFCCRPFFRQTDGGVFPELSHRQFCKQDPGRKEQPSDRRKSSAYIYELESAEFTSRLDNVLFFFSMREEI